MIKPEQIDTIVGHYFSLQAPRPFLEAHILKNGGKSALRKVLMSNNAFFEMEDEAHAAAMAILDGKTNPKSWVITFRPNSKAIFHHWLNAFKEHIGRINLIAADNPLDSLLKGKDPEIAQECIRQCLPDSLKAEFEAWGFEIRGIFSGWSPFPRMIFALKWRGSIWARIYVCAWSGLIFTRDVPLGRFESPQRFQEMLLGELEKILEEMTG